MEPEEPRGAGGGKNSGVPKRGEGGGASQAWFISEPQHRHPGPLQIWLCLPPKTQNAHGCTVSLMCSENVLNASRGGKAAREEGRPEQRQSNNQPMCSTSLNVVSGALLRWRFDRWYSLTSARICFQILRWHFDRWYSLTLSTSARTCFPILRLFQRKTNTLYLPRHHPTHHQHPALLS